MDSISVWSKRLRQYTRQDPGMERCREQDLAEQPLRGRPEEEQVPQEEDTGFRSPPTAILISTSASSSAAWDVTVGLRTEDEETEQSDPILSQDQVQD